MPRLFNGKGSIRAILKDAAAVLACFGIPAALGFIAWAFN